MNPYQLNQEIERFITERDASGGEYSPSDIAYIRQYTGSGGQAKHGATGQGLLHEFFTPDFVCELMKELALRYGYDGGYVLEPSVATGRIIAPFSDKSKIVGFEINPVTARICKISYPQATIYPQYFETAFMECPRFTNRMKSKLTWLEQYPFSLVIGNPPFGIYKNYYSSYFRHPKIKQIEMFFMYYGLKLLKPGGLLVYLTSSNFLRNGITYNLEKEAIGALAELVDAYRLPPVFSTTGVAVDILVFKRK